MTAILGILILALMIVSPIGWIMLAIQRRHGIAPLTYEPRRPVPWTAGVLICLTLGYMLTHLASGVVAYQTFSLEARGLSLEKLGSDPAFILHFLRTSTPINFYFFIAGIFVLVMKSKATLVDLGFPLTQFAADFRRGVTAFIVVVPPVLLIQAVLTHYVAPSTHPLIEAWKSGGSPQLLLWTILSAVIQAPLVEEFFFRGVLQGWLERVMEREPSPPIVAISQPEVDAAIAAADADSLLNEMSAAPVELQPRPLWAPIWISSTAFSLAHFGSGPDPVPIFVLALGLGYLYRQTHRLWPGIVLHMLLNSFSTLAMAAGIE